MKIWLNIINFEYLDVSEYASLLHSIDPSLSNLKEQLLVKVPRNFLEVTRYDDVLKYLPIRQTYTSTERHRRISAEVLSDRFGIGIKHAKAMLRATVQRGMQYAILLISRRYLSDRQHTVKQLNGRFATDTIWAKYLSRQGNVASQIYSHTCVFNASYPISRANTKQVGYSLNDSVSAY